MKTIEQTFEIDNVIQWLSGLDPNEEYNYVSNKHCLIAQLVTDEGYTNVSCGPDDIRANEFQWSQAIPEWLHDISGDVDFKKANNGRTFGAALQRALTYQTSQPSKETQIS